MLRPFVFSATAVALLSACADKSAEIAPSYVSPQLYQSMTCRQLGEEAQRVSARAGQAVAAAFLIKGDGQSAAEVARLKGEMQAIEQANVAKKCGITFRG